MIACQQIGCTRRGELACVVGEIRKVLCIEHQARYRAAMSGGGRPIIVHHGVDLEAWARPTVRRAMPAEDIPDLGLPFSSYVPPAPKPDPEPETVEQLPAVIQQNGLVYSPPPAPPVPPPSLKVIMSNPRPLCVWPGCSSPSLQGVCCKNHGDRYRSLYGTAARLTEAQIAAGPELWTKRLAKRAAVKVKPVVLEAPVLQPAPVAPVVAVAPDFATAKILLGIARKLSNQPDVQLVIEAAIMVLR